MCSKFILGPMSPAVMPAVGENIPFEVFSPPVVSDWGSQRKGTFSSASSPARVIFPEGGNRHLNALWEFVSMIHLLPVLAGVRTELLMQMWSEQPRLLVKKAWSGYA